MSDDVEMGSSAAAQDEGGYGHADSVTGLGEFSNEDARALLAALEKQTPAIPDEVTRAYLARSGFETDDVRAQRLIALAAQKFIAEVVYGAAEHAKSRAAPAAHQDQQQQPQQQQHEQQAQQQQQQRKLTLQVEDVHHALRLAGVAGNVPPPQYFADRSGR